MESANEIDWSLVSKTLMYKNDEQSTEKRETLWKLFDTNNNGFLTLADVDKGLKDVFKVGLEYISKSPIHRAFQAANSSVHSKNTLGKEYVEKSEFRLLIYYLRLYMEYFQIFEQIDTDGDQKIDMKDFVEGYPLLNKWMKRVEDPAQEFKKIDSRGFGNIRLGQFVDWAQSNSYDIDEV